MSMTAFEKLQLDLSKDSKTWLITGVAGFIGSNLLEKLLKLDQIVVGLDNFVTGYQKNLDEVEGLVSAKQWGRFKLIKGDIRNLEDCRNSCANVDYVLHQAALGSVPRSLIDPIATNETNILGFLNMLVSAREAKIKSFTYAASSSTYGDHPDLPKIEDKIGKPLSPYALTKLVNELYSDVFSKCYEFASIGLRYFNIFGPRQDPNGAYAAVIPKWISSIINGEVVYINGDGETSRDYTYIDNVVQANLLAATKQNALKGRSEIINIACGERTTLKDLYHLINNNLDLRNYCSKSGKVIFRDFRVGDVQHSQANISKAQSLIAYEPTHDVISGLNISMPWYLSQNKLMEL